MPGFGPPVPEQGWPPPSAEVAEAFARIEDAEAEGRYRLTLAREMFQAGRRYQADRDAAWTEMAGQARAAADAGPGQDRRWAGMRTEADQAWAQLEERRWGPGGREHFADPRPGDFPGRQAEAEAGG